jgi:LysM repeat protein
MRFGLLISLPAGIPQTGADANQDVDGPIIDAGEFDTGASAVDENGNPVNDQGQSGTGAGFAACSSTAPAGFGYYKVRDGESLQGISEKFGIETSRILELNPGSAFTGGSVIVLPGVEAPGMWNVEELCPPSATPSQ